ncbi:Calcineurin-like_phosphoesterase [Hexamita inflata]|uniref:Calcineurin-like phosphoesterase n=1 Tax=Hexamita inflata TaxID=28002 RepID=A0AA86PEI2_9EUKA|nr:Calcineurin-like phosphoesterase [Hexamita inflata]
MSINITFISDTHELHNLLTHELPGGDIIVHTGDFSNGEDDPNDMRPLKQFLAWFSSLPYAHKIFIAGNHDFSIQAESFGRDALIRDLLSQFNVVYLNGKSHTVLIKEQQIKFYGVPFVTNLQGWAFFVDDRMHEQTANEIQTCDVLLTHDVPYHSKSLMNRVLEIKPRIHAFGHMHEHAGVIVKEGITFINGAQMGFPVYDHIYKPIRVNIDQNQVQIVNNNEVKVWDEFPMQ